MSDFLIIGGGVIGMAIALELRSRGATVTLISREFAAAASHAAAGMLAPQAERIPPSPMLDLCLQSRDLYPEWIGKLESLTGQSAGYWACGILAPCYAGEDPQPTQQSQIGAEQEWCDRAAIHQRQPGLSPEVIGGWWYPRDAQVDNRALTQTLRLALQEDPGIQLYEGVSGETILHDEQQITGLQTTADILHADHYILAAGAWSRSLLPIPVQPKKGQMFSVRVPNPSNGAIGQPLHQVLFGSEIYIVPRQDGRIIIGATSEDVDFTPGNTPAGINRLLTAALRLYPALQNLPLDDLWWGFRPAAPDDLPILGASPFPNLTLATGHYRNGILLAPITAQLIANLICHQQTSALLEAFCWSRFAPKTID